MNVARRLQCMKCGGTCVTRVHRGLCVKCYSVAYRAGTLEDWPLQRRPCEQVTEEVVWLVEQGVPAVRWPGLLNMTTAAIERALYRAGRNDLGRQASRVRRQEAS